MQKPSPYQINSGLSEEDALKRALEIVFIYFN